ncbi:hypothetical protein E2C01_062338 [Portunus trituberculatus]|uniref:Uncharacterized protein n=1 Tax=Portunus trituberculatus TaxID=210409 RepID=A0A5B7H665_PORTR|nr:hypothetical protein [Portunus trituberculatus]
MWRVLACVALMAVAGPQATTGEVYTSIQDLTAVFSLERRVVSALSNYVDDMEAKLLRIRNVKQLFGKLVLAESR